jgi:hypothetical protein
MTELRELRVGGKYFLIKCIGNGAFGHVYKGNYSSFNLGIDLKTSEEVAIKLVVFL